MKSPLLAKMKFEPIFLQVLWQFLSARRSRACGRSFLAAAGGEMRSNYLKNPSSYLILWLRIVDDVRTTFQRKKEYVHIPALAPQT